MLIKSLEHFFYMGGYAFYVWVAYGAGFVVLAANIIVPLIKQRQLKQRLIKQFRKVC